MTGQAVQRPLAGGLATLLLAAVSAQPIKVEGGMADVEVVASADGSEHRLHDLLRNVLDLLAAFADEVVMVRGVAGDVRRNVPRTLEPTGHAVLHLGLERPVDRREAEARVLRPQPLVQLLRAESFPRGSERLGDDHPLTRQSSAPLGDPRREPRPGDRWHMTTIACLPSG